MSTSAAALIDRSARLDLPGRVPTAHHEVSGRSRVWLGAVWAGMLLTLAGCGASSGSPTSTPARSAPETITIHNFAFSPKVLSVAPGARVVVRNADRTTHTFTAASPHRGAFSTGDISPGASASFAAPTRPGTYPYLCLIHQFMQGTLVVTRKEPANR